MSLKNTCFFRIFNCWLFLTQFLAIFGKASVVRLTWLWRTRRICVVKKSKIWREKKKKFVVWTLKPNEGGLRSEVNILAAIFAWEVICEFPNCGVVIVQKRKNLWVTKKKIKSASIQKNLCKKKCHRRQNLICATPSSRSLSSF